MKKALPILFLLIVCLTSCNDKKKCWSIKSTLSGKTTIVYFWGTEDEAVAEIKRLERDCKDVTKTEEKSYKTSNDCLSNNY